MKLTAKSIASHSAKQVFTIEAPLEENQQLVLRYVPDRDMIECEDFQKWLNIQVKENNETLEELTTKIGSHFYNEILPKYMDLKIHYARKDGLKSYAYFVHHQPEYKLPVILHSIFN